MANTNNEKRINALSPKVKQFVSAYLECAFWTEELDGSIYGLKVSTLKAVIRESTAFIDSLDKEINGNYEQAGHDYWLTRNQHGAGYWDRPAGTYSDDAGALTLRAEKAGMVDIWKEGKTITITATGW